MRNMYTKHLYRDGASETSNRISTYLDKPFLFSCEWDFGRKRFLQCCFYFVDPCIYI